MYSAVIHSTAGTLTTAATKHEQQMHFHEINNEDPTRPSWYIGLSQECPFYRIKMGPDCQEYEYNPCMLLFNTHCEIQLATHDTLNGSSATGSIETCCEFLNKDILSSPTTGHTKS